MSVSDIIFSVCVLSMLISAWIMVKASDKKFELCRKMLQEAKEYYKKAIGVVQKEE